jgi:SNF2 family DNA or RNA helicase
LFLAFNSMAPPPAGDESGTPSMFVERVNATTSSKLSQAAKGFVYQKHRKPAVRELESKKPQFVADLIVKEVRKGLQVLVWTIFDEESDILERLLRAHPKFKASALRDLDVLTGSTRTEDRIEMLEDFRHGKSRVLITRADMLGYGMNFQMCKSMVFSGWGFSYEQFYQAIRRAYRPGQTDSVRVHIPIIPELEGQMFDAICRKELQHEQAIEEMERNYIAARQALVGGKERAA